ncbi:MAG: universal stress protein [Desulfobacterales bacterium]|jgi:nucleotide-binding universal stress UspA family protein
MVFRKILTTTRSISELEAAVLSAARIAEFYQAFLTVVHVIEPLNDVEKNMARHVKTSKKSILEASGSYLQEVKEALQKNYAAIFSRLDAYQVRVRHGIPWMEVLKVAITEEPDLTFLGAHRQRADESVSGHSKLEVGSTAEGVIKHERCPTVIVNKPISESKVAFEKIMVSIDFSPSCDSALQFAVDLARKRESKLYLFHMLPIPPQPEYSQTQYEADIRKIKQRLDEEFCNKVPEMIVNEIVTWGGVYPEMEILKSARQNDVDLIVMGSHTKLKGKLQEARWYVGSAVERVSATSDCPVAVITDPKAIEKWSSE